MAKSLALEEEVELHVVAVLSLETAMAEPEEYERVRKRLFDWAFEQAERELGKGFTPHALDKTSPVKALTKLAEEKEADAIVIGSAQHGPVGRVLLGDDVGQQLVRRAPCPVMVAPRGLANRGGRGFACIGVGYDGGPEAEVALDAARDLAERLGASLRLIAVAPPHPAKAGSSGTDSGRSIADRDRMQAALDRAWSSIAGVEAETVLVAGDPAEELLSQGAGLDLLVLGSHGYGQVRRVLLGSVSAKLMRLAPCPVAVVPRGADRP